MQRFIQVKWRTTRSFGDYKVKKLQAFLRKF